MEYLLPDLIKSRRNERDKNTDKKLELHLRAYHHPLNNRFFFVGLVNGDPLKIPNVQLEIRVCVQSKKFNSS